MKLFAFNALAGSVGLLILAVITLPSICLATDPGLPFEVTRSSTEYRESRQFFRISEFFTNRENSGRDVIVRSRVNERAGYYITIKLNKYPYTETVDDAIHLEMILPGDIEATSFHFPLGPVSWRNPLILIGLTGDDWPSPSDRPLAWRVSFANADGDIIARKQSFLWSMEE